MEKDYNALEDVVRNHYKNVVWTHKIQEKQAEIYEKRNRVWNTVNIIAAALTSAGIVSTVFTDPTWLKIITALLSFVTTAVSALLASFDYKDNAKGCKATASKLVALRDELLVLLVKIKYGNLPIDDLIAEFEGVQSRTHAVYQEAPNTSRKAVDAADAAIKNNDVISPADDIDALLPETLRRDAK